jgi:hypothetical protein
VENVKEKKKKVSFGRSDGGQDTMNEGISFTTSKTLASVTCRNNSRMG